MICDYMQQEFRALSLRRLMAWTEDRFKFVFIETSSYRVPEGDIDSVHETLPVRGEDWKCGDKDVGDLICEKINEHWIYDPARPELKCAICHDSGSGLHIHLQTHPNTRVR
ncbi:MAG: hypothetical protein KJO69_09680 [Gammaproteobacteria bacterium]|nr:hypothetical protein [Gammaproteobacteria bacterium]